ncbi:MAG: hypothetical protein ABI548_13090 [Polyangiaceae bacterium]
MLILSCHHEPSGAQLNWSNDAQSVVAPAPSATDSGAALTVASAVAHPTAVPGSDLDAGVKPASSGGADAGTAPAPASPSAPGNAEPASALVDEQGKPLPQTDQRPTLTSGAFQERVALVGQAIISGNAEPASVAFFPLVAYQQVKDVAKPERDYRFRLLANFKRDVLEYHHALGSAAADAKFSGVTVSERDAKWMAPGSEGNKLGYFRVLRSHLHFTLPTGRTRDFELTSLISWRGEWYVVHLHGFK